MIGEIKCLLKGSQNATNNPKNKKMRCLNSAFELLLNKKLVKIPGRDSGYLV